MTDPAAAQPVRLGYRWLLAAMALLQAATILMPGPGLPLPLHVYLPLHSLAELTSVVVAAMVFGITWHGYGPRRQVALYWLACALFAAAWLDLAHTLSYPGMSDLVGPADPHKAIWFCLAGRLAVAATLLGITFMTPGADLDGRPPHRILAGYLLFVAVVSWLVLIHPDALPTVYRPGQGPTPLKVGLEWLVIALLAVAAWRLRRGNRILAGHDNSALLAALLVAILSELNFSLYHTLGDLYSLFGHLFKIVAYGLIYQAVFVAHVRLPYQALRARGDELSEANKRFRDLIETSPDWVWETDAEGHYSYVSPRVRELLGYAPEEVLGRRPFDFMTPAEARRVRLTFDAMARMRLPFHGLETVNLHKDGHEVVLETSGVPVLDEAGRCLGYRGSDRDISERVRGERELEAERSRLRTLVNTIPDLIWLKDPDGVYLACNPTFERFFGARETEIIGKTDYDYVDHDLADSFRDYDRRAMLAGGPSVNEEWITFADDGRRAFLQTIKTPMRDALGRLVGVLGVARDITALREAEDALRSSEENLRRAQAVAHVGSWHLDMRKNVLTWTDENYRIFGVAHGTPLTYEDFLACIHPDDRAYVDREWQAAMKGAPYDIEHRLLVNNEVRWVREKADLMFEPDGELIGGIGITQDVTERKRAEAEQERLQRQLRQAQKMEALGQLTGGIAHDFNNILASVLGYSRLALDRIDPDEDAKLAQYLDNVVTASERARDLIAKMLAYSRTQSDDRAGELAPAPLVKELLRMLMATIPSSIELNTRIDEDTPPIRLEAVDLQQALVNLVVNARDAIGEVGRIEVGLYLSTEVGAYCAICQEPVSGDYVALEVVDSGAGIAPEFIGRIFDPFFTTKDIGKGSGLGLAVVHGIVKKAGGHVVVHSRPGLGSVFRLLFPVAPASQAEAAAEAAAVAPPQGATGRVWVIDDEPMVAEFLAELLSAQGYQVSRFLRPAEALARFQDDPEAVDLVLTDQTMPGMTGGDLARAMLRLRPGLPVFLCTGYSEHMNEQRAQRLGVRRYIAKPIDAVALLTAIAQALAEPVAR